MRHSALAFVARSAGALALVLLSACGDHETTTALEPRAFAAAQTPLPTLVEEPAILTVPTYEGSGQIVHPDVLEFPNGGWRGQRFWMTVTPYPKDNSALENPSILVSEDGRQLDVPAGLVNPIVAHVGGPKEYNSDPELVYDEPSDRLLLFYRFVDKRANTIYVMSSRDGLTWQKEPKAFWVHAHEAVSPTVVPQTGATRATIWYVNTGKAGCHAKSSRVMARYALDGRLAGGKWTAPVVTDLAQPGYVVWHMKVRYVPSKGEYWAVYAAYPQNLVGCDVDDLFFARSQDGVHWQTFSEPLLRHEDRTWTAAAVYRSTFLYDEQTDQLRVWFSTRGDDAKWRLGLARFRYASLLGTLSDTTRTQRGPSRVLPANLGHSEDEPRP